MTKPLGGWYKIRRAKFGSILPQSPDENAKSSNVTEIYARDHRGSSEPSSNVERYMHPSEKSE